MPHEPETIQVGEPSRLICHALERVHDSSTHGTFRRRTPVNLATASNFVVRVTDPSGVSTDISGSVDDAAEGFFGADLSPGQVDEVGAWRYQGFFTLSGATRRTSPATFEVEANLPDPP